MGNDADLDTKGLVIITGASQDGKSVFLAKDAALRQGINPKFTPDAPGPTEKDT